MSGTITMTGEEYDALHAKAEVLDVLCQSRFDEIAQLKAEAEALRAENGRLQADRDRANQYANQQALECNKLSTELEAARGLLESFRRAAMPVIRLHLDNASVHPCDEQNDRVRANECSPEIRALYDALTATPAPEAQVSGPYTSVADALARRYPKPSLLKDCNVSYSNSSRPLAEQGERQEPVAWTVAYPPEYKPFMHHLSFGSESEAARYAQQKTPKAMGCVVVALYTTPQPGPDVRVGVPDGYALVKHEAIEYLADQWPGAYQKFYAIAVDSAAAAPTVKAGQRAAQSAGVPDGERLAELLESVRLGDDEAKPHGSGATYWNNAVLACQVAIRDALAAAPAQPAAQGEFGDAYQGAREDLAIWKRRALEAEQKVRHQEQIIDRLTLEAQGEARFGEPHLPAAGSADQQYPDGIADDLERSDWTPIEALQWYATGKHFDVVGGRTRIIDTGAVASNALKHASLAYLELKGDAELSELRAALSAQQSAPKAPEGRECPRYVCRKCKQETRPPEPYKAYVLCDCGYMTAATIALAPSAKKEAVEVSVPVELLERLETWVTDDCSALEELRALLNGGEA